jgi:hypothetical protein
VTHEDSLAKRTGMETEGQREKKTGTTRGRNKSREKRKRNDRWQGVVLTSTLPSPPSLVCFAPNLQGKHARSNLSSYNAAVSGNKSTESK